MTRKKIGIILLLLAVAFSLNDGGGIGTGPARVLILEDRAARASLPTEQAAVFNSPALLDFLDKKCLQEDGRPAYRMFDVKQDLGKEPQAWRDLAEQAKSVPPPSITVQARKKYSGPLPKNTEATIELLKKYTGA